MTVKEKLLAEIENAPESVLQATLEALEDALDVYAAKAAKAEMAETNQQPIPWSQIKAELALK
jgi:hypothetical protein